MKLLISVFLMVCVSCGSSIVNKRTPGSSDANPAGDVEANILFMQGNSKSTFSYTAAIVGCDSGYTSGSLTEADSTAIVPLGDTGCVFKVSEITIDGIVFTLDASLTWAAGDVFYAASGGSKVRFSVVSNIDALITGDQTVEINFNLSDDGSGSNVSASANAGIELSELEPVSLEISSVAVGVDASGAGLFTLTLGCDSSVVGGFCGDVDLSTVKSSLLVDTFSGAVDIEACNTEVAANGLTATPFESASNPSVPNGGVVTDEHIGPAPMYAPVNRDLILFVGTSDGRCKYFEVNIVLPTP